MLVPEALNLTVFPSRNSSAVIAENPSASFTIFGMGGRYVVVGA